MDWGFLERNVEHKMLRDEIVYGHPAYYYLAILQDILVRFSWILRMYLVSISGAVQGEIILTIFGLLEIFRFVLNRSIWVIKLFLGDLFGIFSVWKMNI